MRHPQKAIAALTIGLFLIYGAIFYQLRQQLSAGYSDFASMYTAGKILQSGARSRLYDLQLQADVQQEFAPNVRIRTSALPFVRPPFYAWLFWPLAQFSYRTAFLLWSLFSCVCLGAFVLVMRRELPELRRLSLTLTLALVFSYYPFFFTVLQGQDSALLLLIYSLSYAALRRNAQFVAGTVLALGTFKFPLVLPFLIPFAFRKKLKVILGFLLTSLGLAVISLFTVGWSTVVGYQKYLSGIDSIQGVNVPKDMPNVRGLLTALLPAQFPKAGLAAAILLVSVLLMGLVIREWEVKPASDRTTFDLGFSLNVVVTVLVSYHCHAFDLCLLLLPIMLILSALSADLQISARARQWLAWTLGCLLFSPLLILICLVAQYPSLLAIFLLAFLAAIAAAMPGARDQPGAPATF